MHFRLNLSLSDSKTCQILTESPFQTITLYKLGILNKSRRLILLILLRNVLDAIKIFVHGKGDVVLESLRPARRTGFATVIFKVESQAETEKYMKGGDGELKIYERGGQGAIHV